MRRKRPSAAAVLPNAVFLVGFMGAGKSSVGRALGERLNWAFEDLDDRIVRSEGRAVADIFRDSGEPAFRQAEHAALQDVLKELQAGGARIVALGGGAFARRENAALLEAAGVRTVFLDAPVEELWHRCCLHARAGGVERPLLRSVEQFGQLYENRRKSYTRAFLQVQTGGRAVDAIAAEIAERMSLKKLSIYSGQGEVE